MVNFYEVKSSYREDIDRSIAFTGADHEFFIVEKGKLILDLIARHFPAGTKAKLLDVGCGHGFVHSCLLAAGHEITGVEVADEVLALARAENPAVDYRAYDGKMFSPVCRRQFRHRDRDVRFPPRTGPKLERFFAGIVPGRATRRAHSDFRA